MPLQSVCGADDLGEALHTKLGDGDEFTLPSVDLTGDAYSLPDQTGNPLYDAVSTLTNDDLTTTTVGGTGTFDVLMTTHRNHIQEEFEAGRITGDQYTKAYIELTTAALGSAVQYLLGKDQAYWQAVLTQTQARRAEIEAVTAAVTLETAKAQLAMVHHQAREMEGKVALVKMELSLRDVEYCIKAQEKIQAEFVTTNIQPLQERVNIADAAIKEYQHITLLPTQKLLLDEQIETARAQTTDTRRDGSTIVGSVGKQKDLYTQQITSYQRDAEYKVAKMYLDSWITQKTLDEGLLAPTEMTNAEIDQVMAGVRANNNL